LANFLFCLPKLTSPLHIVSDLQHRKAFIVARHPLPLSRIQLNLLCFALVRRSGTTFAKPVGMASKVAVFQLHERVAPRFDKCPELVTATVESAGAVKEKKILPIDALKPMEVADLLGRLEVKTLICGGVKEDFQQALKKLDIELIDNVIGDVEDILRRYSKGKLRRGITSS
jgi:predicted Fe-Mo cluster-binding NifX family protein